MTETAGRALLEFVAGTRFDDRPRPVVELARLAVLAFDETRARAVLHRAGGATREATGDLRAGVDLDVLRRDLGRTFVALTAPRLGRERASRLAAAIESLDAIDDVGELTR